VYACARAPVQTFRPDQKLISLVSTSTLAGLAAATQGQLPAAQIFKMICLPPVAHQRGTCLLVPRGDPAVKAMCELLGGCVECESEDALRALMVVTCLMGPFYNILKTQRNWLSRQGVPAADASYAPPPRPPLRSPPPLTHPPAVVVIDGVCLSVCLCSHRSYFVGRTYLGLAQDAEARCTEAGHYDHLVAENTPGGMNEQAIANLRRLGVYAAYDTAQDALLQRLGGSGDGARAEAHALAHFSTGALRAELAAREAAEAEAGPDGGASAL
jgi:pyrroline-5-carboxylate reductase